MPPTLDLPGEDDNSYASSPRPFQGQGRLVSTHGEEDAALLDLAGVAVCWLPPPTPPPPEARRRRRARHPSPSPIAPTPCAPRVGGGALPPPPPKPSPLPFPQNRGERDGGKKNHWSERPEKTKDDNQSRTDGGPDAESMDESELKAGYRSGAQRPTGEGRAPRITRAECESSSDKKDTSSQFLRGDRDRRKRERKGGWVTSSEGSAARQRADEVLARIAALEVSFDRVEEQAMVTPPANVDVDRGGDVSDLRAARVRNDEPSAPDAQSTAGAATSSVAPISILDMAGLNFNVCSCVLPFNSRTDSSGTDLFSMSSLSHFFSLLSSHFIDGGTTCPQRDEKNWTTYVLAQRSLV